MLIINSEKKDIDVKIDWDGLEKFWADQYEADYGNYIVHRLREDS